MKAKSKYKKPVPSRSHITVVSLADPRTARLVFSRLGHSSKKIHSLRLEVFAHSLREIAILQQQMLLALKKHPTLQRKMLVELARDPQLRMRLLRVAGAGS